MDDAALAYEQCVTHGGSGVGNTSGAGGGVGVQPPARVTDRDGRGSATIAEVKAYGDVVLRFISFDHDSGNPAEAGKTARDDGGVAAAAAAVTMKMKAGTKSETESGRSESSTESKTESRTDSETGSKSDGAFSGAFLPNFVDVAGGDSGAGPPTGYGLERADHIVGNVWDMLEHVREAGKYFMGLFRGHI